MLMLGTSSPTLVDQHEGSRGPLGSSASVIPLAMAEIAN